MKHRKLALAVASAAAMLLASASSASANRLSLSSQTWRAVFPELTFSSELPEMKCRVTLEGNFHSATLAKSAGSLIGYVTRPTVEACQLGGMTVLASTLPWHVQYQSFSGTLPSIGSIHVNIIGGFLIAEALLRVSCLVRTSTTEPATGTFNRESGGALTTMVLGGEILTSCGIRGTLGGTSSALTTPGTTTRMTLSLI